MPTLQDFVLPGNIGDPTGNTPTDPNAIVNWIKAQATPGGAGFGTAATWTNFVLNPNPNIPRIYLVNDPLIFSNLRYFKVSAQSVTFRCDTQWNHNVSGDHPQIDLVGVKDFWWHRGRIIGAKTVLAYVEAQERNHAFRLKNCKDVQLSFFAISDDVAGRNRSVGGDFLSIFTGQSGDPDPWGGFAGTNERIWIHDFSANRCGRQCSAIERVSNLVVENYSFVNGQRSVFDVEPSGDWRCEDLHFYDGTVTGGAIAAPFLTAFRNDRTLIRRVSAKRATLNSRCLRVQYAGVISAPRSNTWILEDIDSDVQTDNMNFAPPHIQLVNVDNAKVWRCTQKFTGSGNTSKAIHPEFVAFINCTNANAPDPGQTNGNDFGPQTVAEQVMHFANHANLDTEAEHLAAEISPGSYVNFDLPRPNIEGRIGGSWGQAPTGGGGGPQPIHVSIPLLKEADKVLPYFPRITPGFIVGKPFTLGVSALGSGDVLVGQPHTIMQSLELAGELDEGFDVARITHLVPLTPATESDTIPALTITKRATVGRASETDTTLPLSGQAFTLALARETDQPFAVDPYKLATLALVAETDETLAVTFDHHVHLEEPHTNDGALPVRGFTRERILAGRVGTL